MDNQQERLKLRISWLSGLIEGEGWISLCKIMSHQKNNKRTQSYTPSIGVCNSDLMIMNEVENILIDLGIKYRIQLRNKNKNKECMGYKVKKSIYELSVASHDNVLLLSELLYEYFIGEKKHRLSKLIEYIKLRKTKPKCGKNSRHGEEEEKIYNDLYSYKGSSIFQNPQRLYAKSLI